MGFRFRKSFKVAPGIKLNVSKKSVGISMGTKGARVSVNSSGRVTKSVSIPGTGVSYVKSEQIGKKKTAAKSSGTPSEPPSSGGELPPSTPENTTPTPQGPKKYRALQILGILFIFVGMAYACSSDFLSIFKGLAGIAAGCAILHYRSSRMGTNTRPFYRKRWQIVVAALSVLMVIIGLTSAGPIEKIELSSPASIDLAIPEKAEIVYTYSPEDASADEIKLSASDISLVSIEPKSVSDGKIICQVTPLAAGQVTLSCKSESATAPEIALTITDPAAEQAAKEEAERLAAEKAEQERLAAEKAEQERLAAEQAEQERLAAEEAERQAAAAEQPSGGQTVYITPYGERYHLDPDCGGKNSRPVDISNVGGRTPCKKCAGG